jgi:hypothetical protein
VFQRLEITNGKIEVYKTNFFVLKLLHKCLISDVEWNCFYFTCYDSTPLRTPVLEKGVMSVVVLNSNNDT